MLLELCGPAVAAPRDLPCLGNLRWGMSTHQVLDTLPDARRFDPFWDYGPMKAAVRASTMKITDLILRAMPQVDVASNRWLQVMLERREKAASPAVFERLRAALLRGHGPLAQIYESARRTGDTESINMVWRFPTATINLSFLAYKTSGILHEKPQLVPDPTAPLPETPVGIPIPAPPQRAAV